MEIKLNNSQNVSQPISLYNTAKLNYLYKTESKKENKEKKELQFFSSKKKLINTNLVLSNITNIVKEKKGDKDKISVKKLSINSISKNKIIKKKINNSMKRDRTKIDTLNMRIGTSFHILNLNQNKEKNNKITSKKFSYNKYLITEIKSAKNYKSLYTQIPITPNKTTFKKKPKDINKNNSNNNITCIKNKFSRSMIENNNECNTSTNEISKNNIKNKIKSNNSMNKINSNNKNNTSIQENIIHNTNISHEKILVIDLDETLIHTSFQKIPNPDFKILLDIIKPRKHSDTEIIQELPIQNKVEAYIRIRPGVNEFLSQLSKSYDLYVYSASSKQYLNNIIKNIDKNNIIKKCYCRDDCIIYVENTEEDLDKPNNKYNYVKDLKKINKDLRNIVFVDNNIMSFKLQEKNGIPIKSWYDDNDDMELYKLIPILKNLAGFYDVRIEIEKFVQNKTFIWSKSINWLKDNCLNSAYLNEIDLILKKEQQKSDFVIENFKNNNISIINNNKNNNNNNPFKTNKKIINHINNILINLNDINNNDPNKTVRQIAADNQNKFYEKAITDFSNQNKKINCKTFNFKKKELLKSEKKPSLIKLNKTKTLENQLENEISFSKATPKNQMKLLSKKVDKNKNAINTLLPQHRYIYIPKLNLLEKLQASNSKKIDILSKDNDKKNKSNNKSKLITQNIFIK
jgi:RNA polymerase II subunit A small phosphatase-like protein